MNGPQRNNLGPQIDEDGIIIVGERLSQWYATCNTKRPVIIPNGPYTKLIARSVHEEAHTGVEATVSKIRSTTWTPGIRKIVKRVKATCAQCRILEKKKLEQKMGQLPLERITPSPTFYHTAL